MSEYSELADALIDFEGLEWIPGVAKFLEGFAEINEAAHTGRLTADATQTLLSLLGNPNSPDLNHLLALTAKTLTGPENQALTALDDETRKTVQHLGEEHAFQVAEYAPRDCPNEAAGLIYEHTQAPDTARRGCTQMTDAEREELSKRVAEANKQSANRPR
ncbi:hypothetical protein [Streptomyces scabiei]|uniref:hypothetical protein n=1 Tax=Streptomyces scabiei TaxID=1930 RepID=UPI00299F9543|nr:hypothetical protein [Streptomyces scabiei]MDX3279068.1 hypothetical protein [Streptomyces scabiei]MDX3279079.1 hypothetical protein [Streptomyces scabiei]